MSIGRFAADIGKMGEEAEEAALRGLQSAAYRLEGMVVDSIKNTQPYAPEDTGELTRSVKTTPTPKGAIVSADAPHAAFMEYGARPHFPPLQPLADWAYRKGLADSPEEAMEIALRIARKMNKQGIKPRHFMARAIKEFKRQKIIKQEIVAELREIGVK